MTELQDDALVARPIKPGGLQMKQDDYQDSLVRSS